MKKNPQLAAYMNCMNPEGVDLHSYVEHGAFLLTHADTGELNRNILGLRSKIAGIENTQPQLARQLRFHEADQPNLPDRVRWETIFALLYTIKEEDLVPDAEASVGYLDDAAVVESVLSRHEPIFEMHCDYHPA